MVCLKGIDFHGKYTMIIGLSLITDQLRSDEITLLK